MPKKTKLDKTDLELLKLVQRGDLCVPRSTRIAHLLKIPTSTVHSKLKFLEGAGYIRKYQAVLNSKKAGNDLTIFAILKVRYGERYTGKAEIRDFGKKLAQIPELLEVHSCSADWDYLLKIKAKDTDEYHTVIQDKILKLGGLEKLESFVVYHTSKEELVVDPKI